MKKNFPIKVVVLAGVMALVAALNTQAQVIATYDIVGVTPGTLQVPAINVDSDATASSLTVSTGTPISQAGLFTDDQWPLTIDLGHYFEWTFTPNAGQQVDFTTIAYGLRSTHSSSKFELRTSVDAFSAPIHSATLAGNGLGKSFSVDISSLGTQAGAVTFRLYGFAFNPLFSALDFGFIGTKGNLVISGDVTPVPEPAHATLIAGLLGLGFVAYRRYTQKA